MRSTGLILLIIMLLVGTASAQEPVPCADQLRTLIDQAYNTGDISLIQTSFAATYIRQPGEADMLQVMGSILALRAAMPDLQAVTELMLTQDTWVAVRIRLRGTFVSEMIFPDALPIPANGKVIDLVTNSVFQLDENCQVLAEWNGFDNLSFLAQIGAIPTPANQIQEPLNSLAITTTGRESANADVVQRYLNALNQADFAVIEAIFRIDFLAHNPFGKLERGGFIADWQALRGALPDLTLTVEQTIAQGDWVAALVTMRGTFTSSFVSGEINAPPTNKTLELVTVIFVRFDEQSLVLETWELYDSWSFLTELGLLDAPVP